MTQNTKYKLLYGFAAVTTAVGFFVAITAFAQPIPPPPPPPLATTTAIPPPPPPPAFGTPTPGPAGAVPEWGYCSSSGNCVQACTTSCSSGACTVDGEASCSACCLAATGVANGCGCPSSGALNVECVATDGINTAGMLTVDPGVSVNFDIRVNGVLGGNNPTCSWDGSPNSPLSGCNPADAFPDPGAGQSRNYNVVVTVTQGTSIGSDSCLVTVCNNCGTTGTVVGNTQRTEQCKTSNNSGGYIFGMCYPPGTPMTQACDVTCPPGSCQICPAGVGCSQGIDCTTITTQTRLFDEIWKLITGKKATQHPVVPGTAKTPTSPGSSNLNLSLLKPGNFSDFIGLLSCIFTYLVYFAIPIAVIVFGFGGTMMLTSQGDPGKLGTAKKILLWGVVGFSIVLLAKGILSTILLFLGATAPMFKC